MTKDSPVCLRSCAVQFTDSTLQPLGLSFTPAYILLHASANPPANLSSYGGYDTYGMQAHDKLVLVFVENGR